MFRINSKLVVAAGVCALLATVSPQPAVAQDDLAAAVRALVAQMAQMENRLVELEAKGDESLSVAATYAVRKDSNTELAVSGASLREEFEHMAAKMEALETRLL